MKKTLKSLLVLALMSATLLGCSTKKDDSGNVVNFDTTKEINVITREEGSGTRGAFIELFGLEEKQADGTKKDLIMKEANVENNTNSILTTVAADKYAIGYVSMGSLNDSIVAASIEGVAATTDNVKNGSYAISRPFNIAVSSELSGVKEDFVNFILSKEGQEIAAKSYIAVDESASSFVTTQAEGKIVVGGSSSVSPLMEKLVEAYLNINPNATIELQTSDSTTGMTKTVEGVYDIGMASRGLKDAEKENLTGIQIALDGIAVIVNKANTVTDFTKDQIKSIYLGETVTWDAVK